MDLVIEKHLRMHPHYAPAIDCTLFINYPHLLYVCDEIYPDHMQVRKYNVIQNILCGALLYDYKYFNNDYDVVKAAVKVDGTNLQYASNQLQDNKEIVGIAIDNGASLQYASYRLRDDFDIVMSAIYKDIHNIQYAGPKSCDQNVLGDYVIQNYPKYLKYLSTRLVHVYTAAPHYEDDAVLLCLVKEQPMLYKRGTPHQRANKQILLAALERWGGGTTNGDHLYAYIPPILLYDKEVALTAMNRDGKGLPYFHKFIDDEEVVLAACSNLPRALEFASPRLQNDRKFLLKLIQKNNLALWMIQYKEDPHFLDQILSAAPTCLLLL